MSEDELSGYNKYEPRQTPGDGEGQGGLCAIVHGVTKSWTGLGDCTTIQFN